VGASRPRCSVKVEPLRSALLAGFACWRAPSRARPSCAALLTGRRFPSPVFREGGAAPLGVACWRALSRARPSCAALLTGRRFPSPVFREGGAASLGFACWLCLLARGFARAAELRGPPDRSALPVPGVP